MATPAAILSILVKTQGVQATQGQLRSLDKTTDKSGRRMTGFASTTSSGFSRVGVAARGMQVLAGGAVAIMAKNFVGSASDINESLTKNERLFGDHAKSIDSWSKTTARSLGVSRKEALASAGSFGSLFETIGVSDKPAAQMSKRFVGLASDLASFHNSTPTEALEALRSGLVGEAEPMRRFGALLSETRVKSEAVRSGIAKQGAELTEQQKVQARYSLILKDTTQSQGDFARTSGGTANQMRILRARVTDLGAGVGAALLPAVTRGITALNQFVVQMRSGQGVGGALVAILLSIGNVIRGVASAVGALVNGFRQGNAGAVLLVAALTGLAAGFAAFKVAVLVAAAATRAMAVAQVLLNLAMTANPIGIVIVGLVALGAALFVAYKKFETFRNIVNAVFGWLRSVWPQVVGILTGPIGRAAAIIIQHWGRIKSTFTSALAAIKTAMSGAAGGLANAAGAMARTMVGAFKAALNFAHELAVAMRDLITKAPGYALGVGRAVVRGIINGIRSAVGGIGDAIGGAVKGAASKIPDINPFGDGPGLGALPSGKGAGNLMGAGKHMAPFAAIGARFGLRVSSGLRPGAVTSSGQPSHHATGNAVDLAGSPAGMMKAFRALQRYSGQLAELIYTPGGAYSNGQRYTPTGQLAKDHYDHIHVAFKGGAGDGLGEGRMAGAAKGAGSNVLALAQKVWGLQAPMMGRGGASMPSFKVGNVGKSWATADPAANRVTLSSSLKTALQPGAANRADALKTLVHEFVHIGQRFARTKNEAEGGAESFAQAHFNDIARRLGIDVGSAWLAYPKETAWVGKNRGSNWIERRQFVGPEWGRAAGAVKNASPKPGQGGGQAAVIAAAAKRHGIDPAILWGLFGAESNFGKNLGPSSAGARGPFQFMPQTAKAYGIDPMDFKAAANAAAKYLATYKERGTAGMLLAYNAGPAGKMNPESAAYIPKVKKLAKTWPGAKGTAGNTTSSTAAERVNPLDQKLANADVAIEQAKRGTIKVGNRKISSALQQVAALTGKRQVIGKRIRSIRKALKGKLSGAKRLALTQELSQRLGEHAQLGTDVKALRNPAAEATTDLGVGAAGGLDGGSDPNQPLIDAINAAAEIEKERIEATKAHTEALNTVKAEVKRQTDFATSATATSNHQAWKALADVLSGQIVGRGVAGRAFQPGTGVGVSY